MNLARYLREQGILLPAIYSMAWVGRCEELAQPPILSVLARDKRKPQKRGEHEA